MAGFEAGSSAGQRSRSGGISREELWTSLKEATREMQPHLEKRMLSEADVYAVRNLSLLGFPVPEEFRYYQATHVAGKIYRDEKNDRSGMRGVLFLAKETPHSRQRVVVDISDIEKPLWGLDRFLHPAPLEGAQEREFQIWLRNLQDDSGYQDRPPPGFTSEGAYRGKTAGFVYDIAYWHQRIEEEWKKPAPRLEVPHT